MSSSLVTALADQNLESQEPLASLRRASRPQSIGQALPFRVKLVRTDEQLAKAVSIRAAAYARHVPELGELLREPEEIDRTDKALIFLAESKEDGSPVGTLRMQTNLRSPLALERSIALPERFVGRPLIGVTRLAVKEGSAGKQVKLVLFKALFRYCFATQIEWILIAARPSLYATYKTIGFEDVFPDKRLVPIVTAENLLHRILAFDVFTAERRWFERNHRLYNFMAHDYHPDIEVFSSISGMWSRPRRQRGQEAAVTTPQSLGIPLV